MRKTITNATSLFHTFARRGETIPRGWHNSADRDAQRTSQDLLLLSQMYQLPR